MVQGRVEVANLFYYLLLDLQQNLQLGYRRLGRCYLLESGYSRLVRVDGSDRPRLT